MKTITVSISENEFERFGINSEKIDFKDLLNKISIELARQAAYQCHEIAKRVGLSTMTMDEISAEVKAVRMNAKNRS
jgi:tRNA G26 N,N-dimethylase Trm1